MGGGDAPISCELHDFIEIACLYGYRVRLVLKDGSVLEGKALDTETSGEKREYLVIDNGGRVSVELNRLVKLEALTQGAVFKSIRF